MSKDKLSASEAVFGFVAWITTRDESITASPTSDQAPWAELVNEFCKANDLSEPGEDWHKNLIHPSGECSHGN